MNTSTESLDWCAFAIFISAIAVHVFLFKSTFHPKIFDRFFYNYLIFPKYSWIASKLAIENPLKIRALDFSPLYTYLMTIFYKIFSEKYLYYKLFQILIGSINCFLIYKITYCLFNLKIAVIAGLIAIIYKPLIIYEFILEPITVIIFFNLLTVYLIIYCYNKHIFYEFEPSSITPLEGYSKKSQSWYFSLIWLLPGFTIGLSFITRPNILIFFCLAILWIFSLYYKKHQKFGIVLLSFIVGFCLIISPIMIRNYLYSHSLLKPMMSSGQVFYQGNNPISEGFYGSHPYLIKEMELDPHINPDNEPDFAHELYREFANKTISSIRSHGLSVLNTNPATPSSIAIINPLKKGPELTDTSSFWFQRSLNFITEYPLNYIQLILKKIRYFWSHYEIHDILQIYYLDWEMDLFPLLKFGLIIPFAFLGMFLCMIGIKRYFLLYAMVGNYFLSNLIFFVSSRQRLPALPFLIPFAAYAFYAGMEYMAKFLYSLGISILHIFKSKSIYKRPGRNSSLLQGCSLLTGLLFLVFFFWFVNLPSTRLENFEIMLRLNRESRLHMVDAYDFLNKQEFNKAQKTFQLAYNIIPFHQTRVPNKFLGNVHRKYQEGIKFWEGVIANKKDNAYAKFNLGYLLLNNSLYDRAIHEFRTLDDDNQQGYYGYTLPVGQPTYYLAKCLEKKGEWKKAIHEYEKLKQQYPGFPWIITRLIALYDRTGDLEKAIKEGEILDKLDNTISSSYLLAEAYYQLEDYKKAAEILKSLSSNVLEKYAPFHFLLSACYSRLGIDDISLEPELNKHFIELAVMECSSGLQLKPMQNLLYPEITLAYEKAIADSPDDGKLYYELGNLYFNLGELGKAKSNLTKALTFEFDQITPEIKKSIKMMINEIDFLQNAFFEITT